ncbi:hypothetical protein PINS_up015295 [Pythium insidiosum]|nr:hypothetical protein PINS_up015295 [Pythium insidiosum]
MPETSKELAFKVTFPSLPSASYRLVVEGHRIWVEHNTTKQQWCEQRRWRRPDARCSWMIVTVRECIVEDASKYARKGACVDHDKVMECLGAALMALAEHRANGVQTVDAVPLQGDRL